MKTILNFIHKINPCEQSDTSITWRIMSTIFPECWCCAGIRDLFMVSFLQHSYFIYCNSIGYILKEDNKKCVVTVAIVPDDLSAVLI